MDYDRMVRRFVFGMRFKMNPSNLGNDIKHVRCQVRPQPFHLDDEAARETIFKGLAASGWHTAAIAMSLCVKARPFGPHPLIGLGVDGLRWMLPVRPDDILHIEGEVVSLTRSRTKPQELLWLSGRFITRRAKRFIRSPPIALGAVSA